MFAFWLGLAAQADAAPRSVESLVAEKAQWASHASAGTSMTIEGRLSSLAGPQMRFRNCDLRFQSSDGKPLVRPTRNTENVVVFGRFASISGKPVFLIEKLNASLSDLDSFRGRTRELRDGKPADWYELGRWAAARGRFYDDKELDVKSREAYLEAIQRERKALPPDAVEPLVALSKKAVELGLPDALRMEFVHDAWRRRWDAARKEDSKSLRSFAESLSAELPGAREPLNPHAPELATAYLRNPQGVYRDANEATRFRLHRVFFIEVLRKAIVSDAQPDGSNGYQIAAELDERIPEDHADAEAFREKELALRVKRVENSTRQEVVELSRELEARNQPQRARQVVETWLKTRAERLRKDGPTGLMQAADEYETLLKDRETAVKFLMEAYEQDSSEVTAKRLYQRGYQLKNGRWFSKAEAETIPEDPVQIALRQGRVVAGMTGEQVRKALGAPEAVARAASAGEVNEVWSYSNVGKQNLLVHLRRIGRTGEWKAVSVTQTTAVKTE